MTQTYPTTEMRKRNVSTIAPPAKDPRSLLVSAFAPLAPFRTCYRGNEGGRERMRTRNFEPKDDG